MQPEQPKKFSFLDQFKILKTLGSGYHAQVKLGQDQHGNLYAIKRYKKETANLNTLLHELSIMKALKQQNLVGLVDVRPDATYKKKDETSYKCFAIILEYVGGGELFDLIAETGKFSEKVTRTYFCQMMQGLHYMHSKKYAHRDIKPQNILIGRDYILKLADFGFSCILAGKDGSGVLHTKLGTQGYMAPQVPTKNYDGVKVDIFACGVILFVMYTGHPPFQKANKSDAYYKLIKQKRFDVFWKAHSRGKPINYFKDDFKNLFQQMVAFDPNQRPDTLQISKHPWVTKQICTYSQIKAEFEVRIKRLHQILEQKRLQQQAQKLNHIKSVNNLNNMDDRGENLDFQQGSFKNFYLAEQHKARKLHRLQLVNSDDFIIDQEPTYAISLLQYFAKNKKVFIDNENQGQKDDSLVLNAIKIHQNEDGFTIKYEKKYEVQQENYTESMQLKVQFGHSQDNKLSVLLTHLSGNRLYFKKVAKQIKNIYSFCIA